MARDPDNDALRQVNRSGFPFQLRVEHDVRANSSHLGTVRSANT